MSVAVEDCFVLEVVFGEHGARKSIIIEGKSRLIILVSIFRNVRDKALDADVSH